MTLEPRVLRPAFPCVANAEPRGVEKSYIVFFAVPRNCAQVVVENNNYQKGAFLA
jgi:hypothetical protein